jgi:hypothetical protein
MNTIASGFASIALVFSVVFGLWLDSRLRWLLIAEPQLMESAGVNRVDWSYSCYKGIWRLAWARNGVSLSRSTRLQLRLFCIVNSVLLAALLLFLSGKLLRA